MAHQVVVFGLGRFGSTLAHELYRIGHDVLAVDRDERQTQSMTGQVTYAVTGDSTSSELLEELGIRNFDTAVVAIGTDIQSSVLTTVLLKQQFKLPKVVARALDDLHGRTLQAVGADRVIFPERDTALRTAHSLFQPEVVEYMAVTGDYALSKIAIPAAMVGHTLEEAGLGSARERGETSVLAIGRGRELILSPSKDERLRLGDLLVVGGHEGALEKLRQE